MQFHALFLMLSRIYKHSPFISSRQNRKTVPTSGTCFNLILNVMTTSAFFYTTLESRNTTKKNNEDDKMQFL